MIGKNGRQGDIGRNVLKGKKSQKKNRVFHLSVIKLPMNIKGRATIF
jgi:hypothetical protein